MMKVPHCSVGSANRGHVSFRFAETTLHQAAGMHLFKRCANRVALAILASVAVCCMGCSTFSDSDAQALVTNVTDTATDAEKAKEVMRVIQMMNDIIIPELSFRPPDTIVDAVDFFKQASRDFAKSDASYGLSFVLKLPSFYSKEEDPFYEPGINRPPAPEIPSVKAQFISLYDAARLICDITDMKFYIRDGLVMIVPVNEPEGELVSRTYPVPQTAFSGGLSGTNRVREASSCLDTDDDYHDFKTFFSVFGVSWPAGSSIHYLPVLSRLRITNTAENHALIKEVMEESGPYRVLNIEFQIVAFKAKDIERLQSRGEEISVANLNALRRKGKARPVATASIVTKSSQEAIVKTVKELTYPNELTTGSFANTSQGDVAATMKPDQFEVREVGVILQIVPEILPNNLINLMLNPQWTTLEGWEQCEAGIPTRRGLSKLPLRQPVFNTTSWQTQLTVKSGETILLGGSTDTSGEWVNYGFLRAITRQIEPEVE